MISRTAGYALRALFRLAKAAGETSVYEVVQAVNRSRASTHTRLDPNGTARSSARSIRAWTTPWRSWRSTSAPPRSDN